MTPPPATTTPETTPDTDVRLDRLLQGWRGVALLAAVVLVLFWRAILGGMTASEVVSGRGGDIQTQFLGWRTWGFERLSRGEIPLWNPHTFAGQAFVGNWQSALFYPPNWLHLILSPGLALTVIIAAHVWLAGVLMRAWLTAKGYGPLAATLGGAVYMLSAPVLGHVFPGHVTWMCVVAWVPAVFWCLDGLLDTGRLRYAWWGSAAVALMVLAGYPQPVYVTLLAAGIYLVLAIWGSNHRARTLIGSLAMAVLGGLISAVQSLPGLAAAAESARSGGATYSYASSYAVPVKNLFLALAPFGLGGPNTGGERPYRGDGLLWEVWPYIGAVALVLALTGALVDGTPRRRWAVTLAILFTAIALGPATPLYRYLYDVLPGFGQFRVPGRYLLVVALFGSLLAAAGADAMLTATQRWRRVFLPVTAAAAVLLLIAGSSATLGLERTGLAVALLAAAALLAALATKVRWATPALAALVIAELLAAGFGVVRTASTRIAAPPSWQAALSAYTEGTRMQIQSPAFMNFPLWTGRLGVNGYDPFQSRRWAEFMASSQGMDPRAVTEIPDRMTPHPSWRLLRVGLVVEGDGRFTLLDPNALAPHVFLVHHAEVVQGWAVRLARVMDPAFEFRKTVLLEEKPAWTINPDAPLPSAEDMARDGTVKLLSETPERLVMEVSTGRVGLVVVSDMYASGWKARRLDNGESLPVMPANHVLRAIPVPPGTYRLELLYSPNAWHLGKALTAMGLLVWTAWGVSARPWRQ